MPDHQLDPSLFVLKTWGEVIENSSLFLIGKLQGEAFEQLLA
ncbi:hypothetical protein [Mesorhizobium sp. M0243]